MEGPLSGLNYIELNCNIAIRPLSGDLPMLVNPSRNPYTPFK